MHRRTRLAGALTTMVAASILWCGATSLAAEGDSQSKLVGDESRGFAYRDLAPPEAVLTGLEVRLWTTAKGTPSSRIASIQPIYGGKAGASSHGAGAPPTADVMRVEARPGYAVGAIVTKADQALRGLQVVFMRYADGKLDASDSYSSRLIGESVGVEGKLGDGRPIVGLYGQSEQSLTALGVVFDRDAAATEAPNTRTLDEIVGILERVGARVKRDDSLPGRPIIEIDFSNTSGLGDEELAAMHGLTSLRVLNLEEGHTFRVRNGWHHLASLTNLERFNAKNCQGIKDRVLEQLRGLPKLKSVDLTLHAAGASSVGDAGVEHLSTLPALEDLWLSKPAISDAGVQHLTKLKKLRFLYISNTSVTDEGLAFVKQMPSLRELEIYSGVMTDAAAVHLEGLKNLDGLIFSGTRLSPASARHLAPLTQLKRLRLNAVDDSTLAIVARMSRLENLNVHNGDITDAGVEQLAPLVQLTTLELWGCERLNGSGLERLRGAKNLRLLNLSHSSIDDYGAQQIARFTNLEDLNLKATHITDDGLRALAPLPKLKRLDLFKTAVTGRGLEALKGFTQLEHLDLSSSQVMSDRLAGLANFPHLTFLAAERTNLDDTAMPHIAKLGELRRLYIGGTRLTDAAADSLATMTSLREISVPQTSIGDAGVTKIAMLPNLEVLMLLGTPITDQAIEALQGCPHLRELNVTKTAITNACIPIFESMSPLRMLFVDSTKISYKLPIKLQADRPNLEVFNHTSNTPARMQLK